MRKIIIVIAIITVAVLVSGSKPKVTDYGYDTCVNLWDLAQRHCPEQVDKRDFIEAVVKLNNIKNYTVYANQQYQYPIYGE